MEEEDGLSAVREKWPYAVFLSVTVESGTKILIDIKIFFMYKCSPVAIVVVVVSSYQETNKMRPSLTQTIFAFKRFPAISFSFFPCEILPCVH